MFTAYKFTIKGVLNPKDVGGTGSFIIRTKVGQSIIDENEMFGVIGIASDIGELSTTIVSLDSSGTSKAGEATKYGFSFKTSRHIPVNSYFLFTIPDNGFYISKYPSCNAFSINNFILTGNIKCESKGRDIYVKGLVNDIELGTTIGISVGLINP